MTHFMTRALGSPGRFTQTIRNVAIPLVSHVAPLQHAMVQRLSQLGVAYSGSPIVEGAGQRLFDDSLRGGKGIGGRFLLMVGEDTAPEGVEAAQRLCVDMSDLAEFRSAPKTGVKLVRPDGYVAYEAHSGDQGGAIASVRSLMTEIVKS